MRGEKGMSPKGQEVHLHGEGGVLGRATSREEKRKSLGVGCVGKGEAYIGLMCGAMRQERVERRLGARQSGRQQ